MDKGKAQASGGQPCTGTSQCQDKLNCHLLIVAHAAGVPGVLVLLGGLLLPDSPTGYLERRKDDQAKKVGVYLAGQVLPALLEGCYVNSRRCQLVCAPLAPLAA